MEVVKDINHLNKILDQIRSSKKTIGFVPTMGFLHEGHGELMKKAREETDYVVASIFINPLQFGENEDYDQYPRDLNHDKKFAMEKGVDLLLTPSVKEMYPEKMASSIHIHEQADVLCGKSRPGHFDGMSTVVMKLLHIVQPTVIYFGKKDIQQVAIVKKMVYDYNVRVNVREIETIRELDGLAKSSRNIRLEDKEREEASCIYRILKQSKVRIAREEWKTREEALVSIRKDFSEKLSAPFDYVDLLTYPELHVFDKFSKDENYVLACAVLYSKARLIDNVIIEKEVLKNV